MDSYRTRIILFASLINAAVAGVVSSWASEVLKDYLDKQFHIKLEQNYALPFLLILGVLTWLSYLFTRLLNLSIGHDYERYRNELINALQMRYKKRFEKKMNGDLKFEIQLNLAYTTQGTSQEFIETYYLDEYEEKTAGSFDELFDLYHSKLKRLLIVGEPGSGKTVLLLKFAKKLLDIAERDSTFPVAVILNLSSWRHNQLTFESWLEQNLVYSVGEYGISKQQAKILARSNQLILLLDGLDEVPKSHRNSCLYKLSSYLEKINLSRSIDQNYPEVIICCRQEEYNLMKENAPVQATILIQPLNLTSVNKALKKIQESGFPSTSIKQIEKYIIEKRPVTGLLTTAFFVHLALSLERRGVNCQDCEDDNEFLKLYIKTEINSISQYSDPSKTYRWLKWLADKIFSSQSNIIFDITYIQPEWLERKWQYKFILGLIVAFSVGIAIGMYEGLLDNPTAGFILSVHFITGFSIGFGSLSWAFYKDYPLPIIIVITIALIVLFGKIEFGLEFYFRVGLMYGLLSGELIYFSKIDRIIPKETRKLRPIVFNEIKRYILPWGLVGLTIGVLYGLYNNLTTISSILGLCTGALLGIVVLVSENGLFEFKAFPQVDRPYQRLLGPVFFEYFILFLFTGLIIFISGLANTFHWFFVCFYILIFTVYSCVFTSIGKHFVLRLLLWNEGNIPFQLVGFLNTVSERTGLLEKDGGQWRFRHQLIQDVLAGRKTNPSPATDTHDNN